MVIIVTVVLFFAWLYVLHDYAPGLRTEAGTVPALVQQQLAQQHATYVPGSAIAPDMENAIVAIEDRRFYSHPGIDPQGMLRAFIINLSNQHLDQGGSTLEQQLIKRTIVPDDHTMHGKLRSMALAWAVDQDFSKPKVIELYLNAAYFGQGAYGIGQAASVYFNTDPAHLTLAQSAFLAALPQAPSVYGANPTAAAIQQRQQQVLEDMEAQGYISAAQEQAASSTRLVFTLPNP